MYSFLYNIFIKFEFVYEIIIKTIYLVIPNFLMWNDWLLCGLDGQWPLIEVPDLSVVSIRGIDGQDKGINLTF